MNNNFDKSQIMYRVQQKGIIVCDEKKVISSVINIHKLTI